MDPSEIKQIVVEPTTLSSRFVLAWEVYLTNGKHLDGLSSSLEGVFESILESLRWEDRRTKHTLFQSRTEY